MAKKEIEEKLKEYLKSKGDKISKPEKLEMLMKIQKGFLKKKYEMVDFEEPIMLLIRRDGNIEFHEKVKQGKFVFTHSNGEARWMEIRPQDQMKFQYGDRRVRCYLGHEDRPFTGFDNSVMDTESLVVAINKVSITKQKYEESLAKQKIQTIKAWLWILLGIGGFIAIVIMALGMFGQPLFDYLNAKNNPKTVVDAAPMLPGMIMFGFRKVFKRGLH